MRAKYLIINDPTMDLTYKVPLTHEGKKDHDMLAKLSWLSTEIAYCCDTDEERDEARALLKQQMASVPAWREDPFIMQEHYIYGGSQMVNPYEQVLRMHPDNVATIPESFRSQCDIKPKQILTSFMSDTHASDPATPPNKT
jgi:hypothetical protein